MSACRACLDPECAGDVVVRAALEIPKNRDVPLTRRQCQDTLANPLDLLSTSRDVIRSRRAFTGEPWKGSGLSFSPAVAIDGEMKHAPSEPGLGPPDRLSLTHHLGQPRDTLIHDIGSLRLVPKDASGQPQKGGSDAESPLGPGEARNRGGGRGSQRDTSRIEIAPGITDRWTLEGHRTLTRFSKKGRARAPPSPENPPNMGDGERTRLDYNDRGSGKWIPCRMLGNEVMKLISSSLLLSGVLFFAPSLSAQTALWKFFGNSSGDSYGKSVTGLDDVNGDGVPDVAVGAPQSDYGGLDAGSVKIYSGLTGQLIRVFVGIPGSNFGAAVASAGDVDGDGRGDIIVGAPFARVNGIQLVGEAVVISIARVQVLHRFKGAAYLDAFGTSVGSAGDVDGDGIPDIQIGATSFFQGLRGYVRVFAGSDGSLLHDLRGAQAGDFFGTSLAEVGDQDGDGHDDLLIGAPQNNVGPGYALVISGRTGGLLRSLSGVAANDQFGQSVTGLEDLDGDQIPELAVGAYRSDLGGLDAGSVTVYSGATGAPLRTMLGDGPHHWLGFAVANAGDVDGDGFGDLIVAAHGDNSQTVWTTYGRVYSGFDGQTVATVKVDFLTTDSIIQAVSGLGDVDSDGRDDYLVSDFWNDEAGTDFGAVWVIAGCPSIAESYGESCAGSAGFSPRLEFQGCPSPGALTQLSIENALGGANAQLLVSARGRTMIGKGNCVLLVRSPFFVIPIQLGGASGTPGVGNATLPIQIPPSPNLIGWRFNAQARIFDPGTLYGNAFTNGVEIVIR